MATSIFRPTLSASDADVANRYGNITDSIRFGVPDSSNKSAVGFSAPVLIFSFRNAFGNTVPGSPTIYVRAPNSLNLTQTSNYSPTGNIFGANIPTISGEGDKTSISFLGQTGSSFLQAIAKNIVSAETNLQGYIQSAGQSGIDQAEFTTRNVINPMQQLLYKGATPKQYSIPLILRPKNIDESEAALNIISAFKIASSPKITAGSYTAEGPTLFSAEAIQQVFQTETALSFGYPDLVQFDLVMFEGNADGQTEATPMYESLHCVINSVSVDYGQQKMSFFIPHTGVTKYYPTEINLTLSLQEVVVRSVQDAIDESGIPTKTIR